ncbi:maleylpyruvate isomerase N-terminal domain-containing protein [Nonomuraea sp. NPDC050663]|uniref:maleylpyruvate isomerase N-terminal domain-containing protein n=1 Tax=Nonomuraea sp. NPDC050663 TaxID=3364370 RepID=UPI0037910778
MIRESYLLAANSAVSLLGDPAVAAAWHKPSALTEFSVGGLAAHLANQLVRVEDVLAADRNGGELIPVLQHFVRSPWVQAGLDHESNVSVRQGGEKVASEGPETLTARVTQLLGRLTRDVPAQEPERVVFLPWAGWSLDLDDFLLTRMMEIVVHSDDLAASVGISTPELPAEVIEPVVDLLAKLAVYRHGPTAVIRALSRTERAPATISAF